jgi:aspartyl-tRNA(Asn)/glutamyl-tRNA(Gln) amidotransferase subunit C
MKFSKTDLDHIISLAHLDVSADLRETFLPQIQSILHHMESINQFDLAAVAPAASAFAVEMTLREDEVVSQTGLLLAENAPAWADGAFLVPRIG